MSDHLREQLAEGGQQPRQRDRPSILGPRVAVHANEKLPGSERGVKQQDFEASIPAIVLDGNSQVCFHKRMVEKGFTQVSRAQMRA